MGDFYGIPYELVLLIGANFFIIIILFIMNLSNRKKIRRLRTKYNRFMNGLSDANIEEVLENCIYKTNSMIDKNKQIEYRLNEIESGMYYCLQKFSVIRYNAFDNVGSDLSFSIALLNNNDDGIVISSLYSRESSSTYAKPVVGGKSKYALSAEEIKAIDTAKKVYNASKYSE